MRDKNFNTRNEDRSPQGVAAWKGNPKGNPQSNGQDTSKDRNMEIALNGPQKAGVREEIRAAWSTTQTTKRKITISCSSNETEGTRKVTEKEILKERTQRYQSIRKFKQAGMLPVSNEAMPKEIRMCLLTESTHCNPKVDATGGIRVYSSTQAKPVTANMVMQQLPYGWKKQKN